MYHDNDEFPVPYSLDVELRALRDRFKKSAADSRQAAKDLNEQAMREERAAHLLDTIARENKTNRAEMTELKKQLTEVRAALQDAHDVVEVLTKHAVKKAPKPSKYAKYGKKKHHHGKPAPKKQG